MSSNSKERLSKLANQLKSTKMGSASVFSQVPLAPPDAIFHLSASYKADTSPQKVDLSVGAYRTEEGKPWILPVVAKAEKHILNDPSTNHEYLGIEGLSTFTEASVRLLLGDDSAVISEKRYATVQTVSGTGANSTFAAFCNVHFKKPILVSNPTWGNHHNIFTSAGLKVVSYPYFNKETRGLDLEGMLKAIHEAESGSIILLHACAHNPTGVDPNQDEWKKIADAVEAKKILPFFDCAYQGFASGDVNRDAWAIRYFAQRGFEFFVAQSFAKNFGLYGERCGALTAVTSDREVTTKVLSQLKKISRATISNPPKYGAQIVSLVLNNPEYKEEWFQNLRTMSERIIQMRKQLYDHLQRLQTPGTWNHIIDQIGMFSFTGLNAKQAQFLKEKYHIFLTDNGRISMAGLSPSNVKYFAEAVDDAVRNS
ncbi:Aspartate aminotransferase, cytoplasmic [Entomophthora muscae]|uniref:Aspartate aminotransferase, cytoplasmic n=1 Tax=Entomophthora muscae TaxID=34485 RepID=A0ACC2TNP9_9FUNG|nr:Aspartate aminotransferase, cytoplasmic [Entomophthora muscae]